MNGDTPSKPMVELKSNQDISAVKKKKRERKEKKRKNFVSEKYVRSFHGSFHLWRPQVGLSQRVGESVIYYFHICAMLKERV